jgi:tetratricopeptide (TPR) repeat protein
MTVGCPPADSTRASRRSRPDVDIEPVTKARIEAIDPELLKRTDQALTLLADGRAEEAWDELHRIVATDSLVFKAHAGLVTAAVELNRLDSLQSWYEKKLATHVADAGLHYGLATVLSIDPSRLTMARLSDHLRILNRLAPAAPEAPALEAQLLQRQGRQDQAATAWRRTLELDPDHPGALLGLAIAEYDPRRPEPSIARVERALAVLPDYRHGDRWEAHLAAGGMYLEAKRFDKAIAHYRKAESLNVVATWRRVDWAALLWRAGRREDAIEAWRHALDTMLVGSPAGLGALRSYHALAKGGLDYSSFLPAGSPKDYRILFTHLGQSARATVSVPREFAACLSPKKAAYFLRRSDNRTLIVQAAPSEFYGSNRYLSDPRITLYRGKRQVLDTDLGLDHLLDARLMDIDRDGVPEAIVVGMDRLNSLKLFAFSKGPRGYALAFQVAARCMTPSSGIVVADLDGEGPFEIVTVADIDNWPTIYRLDGDRLEKASADFPRFFTYYQRLYGGQDPKRLSRTMEPEEAARVKRRLRTLESWGVTAEADEGPAGAGKEP